MAHQIINKAIIDNLSLKIQNINLNGNIIECPPSTRISVVINYIVNGKDLESISEEQTLFFVDGNSVQVLNNDVKPESYTLFITIPTDAIVNPKPLDISTNFPWVLTTVGVVVPVVTILGIKLAIAGFNPTINRTLLRRLNKATKKAEIKEQKAAINFNQAKNWNLNEDLEAARIADRNAKFELKAAEFKESNKGIRLPEVMNDSADTFHIADLEHMSYNETKTAFKARKDATIIRKNAANDRKSGYAKTAKKDSTFDNAPKGNANRIVNEEGDIVDSFGNIVNDDSIFKLAKNVYKTPEGKFINEKGQYLNNNGLTVDEKNRLIDEDSNLVNLRGEYLNENSQLIDRWSRPIDSKGRLINADNKLLDKRKNVLLDENGDSIEDEAYSKQLYSYTKKIGKIENPENLSNNSDNGMLPDLSNQQIPQIQGRRVVQQPPPNDPETLEEINREAAKRLQKQFDKEESDTVVKDTKNQFLDKTSYTPTNITQKQEMQIEAVIKDDEIKVSDSIDDQYEPIIEEIVDDLNIDDLNMGKIASEGFLEDFPSNDSVIEEAIKDINKFDTGSPLNLPEGEWVNVSGYAQKQAEKVIRRLSIDSNKTVIEDFQNQLTDVIQQVNQEEQNVNSELKLESNILIEDPQISQVARNKIQSIANDNENNEQIFTPVTKPLTTTEQSSTINLGGSVGEIKTTSKQIEKQSKKAGKDNVVEEVPEDVFEESYNLKTLFEEGTEDLL